MQIIPSDWWYETEDYNYESFINEITLPEEFKPFRTFNAPIYAYPERGINLPVVVGWASIYDNELYIVMDFEPIANKREEYGGFDIFCQINYIIENN